MHQQKTIREHLKKILSDPAIYMAAEEAMKEQKKEWRLDTLEPTPADALEAAFVWKKTPQKHLFWSAIWKKVNQIQK